MPGVDDIASFVLLALLIIMFIGLYVVLSAYRRRLNGDESADYNAERAAKDAAGTTAER